MHTNGEAHKLQDRKTHVIAEALLGVSFLKVRQKAKELATHLMDRRPTKAFIYRFFDDTKLFQVESWIRSGRQRQCTRGRTVQVTRDPNAPSAALRCPIGTLARSP